MVAAAYMAKAGLKVVVLERNSFLGGGSITREVTAPGFRHDLHSMMHIAVQSSPILANDELGLKSRYGLAYHYPEALFTTVFDDESSLTIYHDLDRTCESIARISPIDAEAYRAFAKQSLAFLPLFVKGMWEPPMPQGAFWALLDQSAEGRAMMWAMQQSLMTLLDATFHHEKIKVSFLKLAAEFSVAPDEFGTGVLLLSMPGLIHTYRPGIPLGGAQSLADALVACLTDLGVEMRTSSEVEKVLVSGGKTTGVRLAGGEVIEARRGVIGQIHPWLLGDMVEGIDAGIAQRARRTKTADLAFIHGFLALKEPPKYHAGTGLYDAMWLSYAPSSVAEIRQHYDDLKYGKPWSGRLFTAVMASWFDPSRAPEGCATVNLLAAAPYELAEGGSEAWDREKDARGAALLDGFRQTATNIDDSNILGYHVHTPLDMARFTPTFQRGDLHGLGKFFFQFGGHRPTPELSNYRVPGIGGLYLAGAFMHPPGGITGGGRNTAAVMCADMGIDFDKLK